MNKSDNELTWKIMLDTQKQRKRTNKQFIKLEHFKDLQNRPAPDDAAKNNWSRSKFINRYLLTRHCIDRHEIITAFKS